jgi:uncharacterized membrane protein YedE/YeeE
VGFLPFWLGGLALGGVAVWSWWLEGRPLGVSGQVTRVVEAVAEPEFEREAKAFADRDPDDVMAALLAATAAELGEPIERDPAEVDTRLTLQKHVPVGYRGLFLLFLGLGAATAALVDGSFAPRWTLGPTFEGFIGEGWPSALALVGGGIAVGFGTRMAGGCTTGHGLVGCARLRPRSVLATAVFLATAIMFTLLTMLATPS